MFLGRHTSFEFRFNCVTIPLRLSILIKKTFYLFFLLILFFLFVFLLVLVTSHGGYPTEVLSPTGMAWGIINEFGFLGGNHDGFDCTTPSVFSHDHFLLWFRFFCYDYCLGTVICKMSVFSTLWTHILENLRTRRVTRFAITRSMRLVVFLWKTFFVANGAEHGKRLSGHTTL